MAFVPRPRRSHVAAMTVLFSLVAAITLTARGTTAVGAGATGYVSICKQESGTGLEGIVFNFSVAQRTYSAPVGACSPAFAVSAGRVTVTELARSGSQL